MLASLPFWPLLGAILVGLVLAIGKWRERAHHIVVLGVAISAVLSLLLFAQLTDGAAGPGDADPHAGHAAVAEHTAADDASSPTYTLYRWISLGQGQWIDINYYLDPLTAVMLVTVTVVSLMVVIYAIGYMRDHHGHPERGYERFFAFLGLFVFSMCMLVLAGNFVLLYLGWELVGLCSYLLIGFYYQRPEAAAAAKKAFLVNRIGDFGFALGIFSIYMFLRGAVQPGENPLDYAVVFKYAHVLAEGQFAGMSQATFVALLLMCGALGKSAQFPLHVWLPDAMEGPTPVSALIHAATMVTAGMYMVARCWPIFGVSETAQTVIVVLGMIGACGAATMAMAQYDMKRILAYSTISQLAYMFVGLGVGAPDSSIFHLYTHAFFKALLFLCAGSVMHAMGGVIDLRHFSGLRRILPKTYWLTLIGCLALAGFPLLAGFWSKDEIVHACFAYHPVVGVIMLATAGMTAYYTFRMFYLCFHGPTRLPKEAGEHPHESPPVMLRPLYVLAAGAIVAGYVGVTPKVSLGESFLGFLNPHGFFHRFLAGSTLHYEVHPGGGVLLMYVSAIIAIAGIVLAYMRYGEAPTADPDRAALGGLWRVWNAKYYVDEIYERIFVQPLRRLGEFFFATDNHGIDGLIWLVTAVPRGLGAGLRFLQSGALQAYALGMVIGLAVLMLLWRWMDAATIG
ncbi:MAG: NADH-quinone oxidoreductase subunit L [Planctomycetes bacterium]|nr:NADH-quinone oxidoreductase subunit L [Planctomycetota bacterium]